MQVNNNSVFSQQINQSLDLTSCVFYIVEFTLTCQTRIITSPRMSHCIVTDEVHTRSPDNRADHTVKIVFVLRL